ncbi:MAG: hypothetical protein RI100_06370 [Nitrosarchaeum sp.]|uniref:hypothetical protein n=1 Tax=Nitrosarchaeum sp. TaxID=2026886 RepID=UPI002DF45EEC|nr:hypothetical protein [Nitrosarchaeum sp.]
MKLICMHCSKPFEGENTKFCSQGCRDSHIVALERKIREIVENDTTHVKKFSQGY